VTGAAALPDVLRIVAVAVVLFGVTGLGLTRLALPDALRSHEWLWVLPVGAVATAFAMTPLGFAHVPFAIDLGLVIAGGAALSAYAVMRRGWPQRPAQRRTLAWPVYLAVLLFLVALIPLFRSGFLTVIGNGSDAHLAAGTAEFLKHAPPLGEDPSLPVDQVPLVWRSKQAIYYALASVSALSGLETWQVLSVVGVLLLTLAAAGWFVFAREVLGAGVGAAAIAMVIAGLDRMVIHTGVHPYFNQTWGYLTLPFALTLAWLVVRRPSPGGAGLMALFLILCAFAYPLAMPLPALVLVVMWWVDRRDRRRAGAAVFGLREGWRRLQAAPLWTRAVGYLVLLSLVVPFFGVWEKLTGATQLLINPHYSLAAWGGDLFDWFPEQQFFSIVSDRGWWAALAIIAALAGRELWRLERPARYGLLSVIAAGALVAGAMRARQYGWYFHFKMLAFVGPLVVVLAAVALTRIRHDHPRRWVRYVALFGLVTWVGWAMTGAKFELASTYDELPRTTQALASWNAKLPPGASIRLDVPPPVQLWTAYMLHGHPLCSQRPLTGTSYPHVPLSRAADFVLVRYLRRPFDAVGAPVLENGEYTLYRLRPGLPGGDRCSQRMIQTVKVIQRG
jgi:hypothetical protein